MGYVKTKIFIGAYHLCNNPAVALEIAYKQEKVGQFLGSSSGKLLIKQLLFIYYY